MISTLENIGDGREKKLNRYQCLKHRIISCYVFAWWDIHNHTAPNLTLHIMESLLHRLVIAKYMIIGWFHLYTSDLPRYGLITGWARKLVYWNLNFQWCLIPYICHIYSSKRRLGNSSMGKRTKGWDSKPILHIAFIKLPNMYMYVRRKQEGTYRTSCLSFKKSY